MKTIELEHQYSIMEAYPNILFESISVYNEYLKAHTKEETDKYIKDWIHNKTIEYIGQDIKNGVIKELPEGWKENYTMYLNEENMEL
jgi:hypothetical protein